METSKITNPTLFNAALCLTDSYGELGIVPLHVGQRVQRVGQRLRLQPPPGGPVRGAGVPLRAVLLPQRRLLHGGQALFQQPVHFSGECVGAGRCPGCSYPAAGDEGLCFTTAFRSRWNWPK